MLAMRSGVNNANNKKLAERSAAECSLARATEPPDEPAPPPLKPQGSPSGSPPHWDRHFSIDGMQLTRQVTQRASRTAVTSYVRLLGRTATEGGDITSSDLEMSKGPALLYVQLLVRPSQ